jgi:hypothetical protein
MTTNVVFPVINSLKISDPLTIGEILHARGLYQSVHSARVQAQKALNNGVDLKQLERGKGYYRVKGCESEYGDHARLLTKTLAEFFKYFDPIVYREISIPAISLRADSIIFLTKENKGRCLILEVCHTETPEYLQQKLTAWNNWDKSLDYLSSLFGWKIPHFDIVIAGEHIPVGCYKFNRYLEEVKK